MADTAVQQADFPKRILLLSLLSLLVPVLSSVLYPEWTSEDMGMLVWVLALAPAFLLSYYRGWRGSSMALAAGMAAFSLGQAILLWQGAEPPGTEVTLAIVAVLLMVTLGSGWLASVFRSSLRASESMALTDAGTGLPNRRHATLHLERAFEAARRGNQLSVVAFDLDHFKGINDRFGHATGDRVLADFGRLLQGRTRQMALSARTGGEEFISILDGVGADGAQVFANRVLEDLRKLEYPWGGVSASAGIAEYEAGMSSPDVLLAAADQALYRAKQSGRDQVATLAPMGIRQVPAPAPATASASRSTARAPATASASAAAAPAAVPVPAPSHAPGTAAPDPASELPPGASPRRPPAERGSGELILVLDDDPAVLRMISRALHRLGYSSLEATRPEQALEIVRGLSEPLDLVLTDVVMPSMSGFRLVEVLEEQQGPVRVVYMSGYHRTDVEWAGTPGAVRTFLEKPIEFSVLARTIRAALDVPLSPRDAPPSEGDRDGREDGDDGEDGNDSPSALRARLTAQTAMLEEAVSDVVQRLAWAAEYRDDVTGQHAQRVGLLTGLLAEELGIEEPLRGIMAGAAPLHDLGKIAIPDGILHKPGPLTASERILIETHASLGADLLSGSRHPLIREAERVARSHHEWWNGSGYPDGLRGEEIPRSARIVAVADVFDSLTHDRPYRPACTIEETMASIVEGSGVQFDPAVVDALSRLRASGALARVDATEIVAWPDAAGGEGEAW
ncbi:MAG: diguanylate cyclase [Gemmatimonadota bacterium]